MCDDVQTALRQGSETEQHHQNPNPNPKVTEGPDEEGRLQRMDLSVKVYAEETNRNNPQTQRGKQSRQEKC